MARIVLSAASLVLSLLLAEGAYRLLAPAETGHRIWFEDAARRPTTLADALRRGEAKVGPPPRRRPRWVKPVTWYICYRGGRRPGMDERGCVQVRINRFGLRDREDLTYAKPAGETRVLCLGDSFTFGYGVPVEWTWPRLVEPLVRVEGRLRTINCGLAGTLLVDECWWELRDRFHRFEPDVVLQTICLNDLAPFPDTIAWFRPEPRLDWLRWSRLASAVLDAYYMANRTNLDPGKDYGEILLQLPDHSPLYEQQGMPPEAAWKNGGPQTALREMRDWCRERGVRLGVVVWPLFQGLEADREYPFETLHRVVAEFCAKEGIAHLDLLETFRGHDSESLWVDPADQHPNEVAQRLAAPRIAGFVQRLLAR